MSARILNIKKNLKDQYQCHIFLLYSGNHLPKSDSLGVCNNSTVTHDTLGGTHWSIQGNPKLTLTQNQKHFESYQFSISVNTQTLIGQVGEIMGITLGWFGMSLIELIDLFWQPALLLI